MITFQEMLRRLSRYWEDQGCIIHQGYDLEVGAGTMNPATFLRCLGPEPYRAAYVEPCRRPSDGRYGENPNRTQHYFQYQVILKPSPLNMQELYLESLKALGIDLNKHDIRFVHDDWENPTIGAWGLGWEVWMDGMEITQYTYFQSVGGFPNKPVTGELTYGLERLAMYLQNIDSFFDLNWNEHLRYGDIYHRSEVEWSHYNFEEASTEMWFKHFNDFEAEARKLMIKKLPIPAYEFVMKCSHAFNILDARGAISVTERTGYVNRIRSLAKSIAENFIQSRKDAGFPLLHRFPEIKHETPKLPTMPNQLLKKDGTEDFLLEIGSEELPASFVPIGIRNLKKDLKNLLKEEGIEFDSIEVYGTPRRLAAHIKNLTMALPSRTEERKGPTLDKAFDENGQLTPAGKGFFRSVGQDPVSLEELQKEQIREIKGASYLFAKIRHPGRFTAAILAEKLPVLILNLDFPKKMRWADLDITYPRPIRWIVALFGDQVVPFQIANVVSGRTSLGHRQLQPEPFDLSDAKAYESTLERHSVLVDPVKRQQKIEMQLDELEEKVIERDQVIPQVVHLTEWPEITVASFDENFLKAPKEVLTSEMIEHQKYFPLANSSGNLVNRFVITCDTTPTDQIRAGNQKVLSARLSDGVFLYEKGLHIPLDEYHHRLKHVTFLAGFGSLYDKVLRLIGHVDELRKLLQLSTYEQCKRAGELSKADLVSEMVFEFPGLQGIIGKHYAIAHGENPEVAQAIEEQWMPVGENAPLPSTPTGTVLSLADKFDNLISCFSADLKPTSSSDPYALRRQALGIIKILIQGKHRLLFDQALELCCRNFIPTRLRNKNQVIHEIKEFFINRIKTVFQDYGFSKDEIEASIANGFTDIYDTYCKVQALHNFRTKDQFLKLYEVYKRAKGQLNGQEIKSFDPSLLREEAEKHLSEILDKKQKELDHSISKHDYESAYELISEVQQPLANLFDSVRILADDPQLKDNRIALLQRVFALFAKLLDFSLIVEHETVH